LGVAVTPDGSKVYVADITSDNVYVINALNDTVLDSISVGSEPAAFGKFIGPGTSLPLAFLNFSASPHKNKIL